MTPSDGKLKGVMGAWLADCIADKSDITKDFARFQNCEDTITVTVDAGEGKLRPVRAKFLAQADGKIQVELSLVQEDGKTEDDCRMTLTMQGTLETKGEPVPAEPNRDTYTFITTVKWGSPKIEKGIGTKEAGP